MLGHLVESSPRHVRRRFSTFVSIVTHAVIGGAAVAAARPVPEPPTVSEPIPWHLPPAPPPPDCNTCGSPRSGESAGPSRRGDVPLPDDLGNEFNIDGAETVGPIGDTLTISTEEWLGPPGRRSGEATSPLGRAAVDREVVPLRTNPAPHYPATLRAARIEGTVRARFVVDTTGRVQMETVFVEESDHPLFADAVVAALRRARFTPAELAGRKVRQLVVQPFAFVIRE